jgi:diguanylate cyclase (GGDEF)-like protein/putative nucleotidyltransferase with HDIG domain
LAHLPRFHTSFNDFRLLADNEIENVVSSMTWAELPVKIRLYIAFLSVIGSIIFAWSTLRVALHPQDNLWIALTVLALLSLPLTLRLESVSSAIGIGDAYIMSIGMMYGTAPCIIATFLQISMISTFGQRPKKYLYKVVFNTACTICCAWLYSTIYHLINNNDSTQWRHVIVPAAVLVATYFFSNSILTSIPIAWSRGESILKFWAKACMPLAVDYSISGLGAAFLVVLKQLYAWFPLAAAPLLFVLWAWNKYHKARLIQVERHLEEQTQLYYQTVESLALAVDAKDQTTYGHIRRVKVYAIGLAKLCGIKDSDELKAIETGSLLHDIGKLAIDDYILNKPGRLSPKEFEKMKMHAAAGDEILQQVHFPFPVAKYVRYHHERWDGLGYPDGLKGEEIPLGARILAISDAFDAIRFSRPYKLSISTDEALDILRAQAGLSYDPRLVRLFTENIIELEKAAICESENAPQLSFRKYSETDDNSYKNISPQTPTPKDFPTELIRLSELCLTMLGTLDLIDFLPILTQRLKLLVQFSTCAFYINTGDDRINAAYVSGKLSEFLQEHAIEMGKGISGWVAAYRRPMINTGPALDFQQTGADFSLFADTLVVPIIENDESLGTISLYAEKPISYNQNDLQIIQTVASLIAPLFSNFRKNRMANMEGIIDPVTNLHRISYLTAISPQLISQAGEARTPISLIYIEIKNLGQITRNFGSNLGNSLLKKIAESIKPELRETDIFVRYGHQGFVAFLPGVGDDQALRCVQRLEQQIRGVAASTAQGFTIDCQTGIAFYPRDGASILALLQSAQDAMKVDSPRKAAQGKKVVEFYRA